MKKTIEKLAEAGRRAGCAMGTQGFSRPFLVGNIVLSVFKLFGHGLSMGQTSMGYWVDLGPSSGVSIVCGHKTLEGALAKALRKYARHAGLSKSAVRTVSRKHSR